MRAVQATAIVWILCRFAFWIGYHRSAAMRGLGAAGVMLVLIVLIYLVARIAFDLGGPVAAAAEIALFVAIEFVLFRSEEHTSELQSLMRISYAVFCLKKKK